VHPRPILVVIGGPAGTGKTTLAHHLARTIGCPAICRDEIKEGMVHRIGDYVAAPGDELTLRTLSAFFQVLELLVTAGVTVVAEAAFQDRVWRPRLQPLSDLADVRLVCCHVTAETAWARIQQRRDMQPARRAHADAYLIDREVHAAGHDGFGWTQLGLPQLAVDTSDGYRPGLDEIVAFATASNGITRHLQ
jgi:predicted kinase